MKVKFTKAFDLVSGDAKVYHFDPGEHRVHDSILGAIVDKHLDAVDRNYITALQDRILMLKASDPSVNSARMTGAFYNPNDIQDTDDELPEETQVGYPSATGADSVVPNATGTEVDAAGNVVNTQATVTTPAIGLGAATQKNVGKANPRLISTQDTVSSKVNQTAQANTPKPATKTNGNGNGSKPATTNPATSTGGNTPASGQGATTPPAAAETGAGK